jgi:hypothetical protein
MKKNIIWLKKNMLLNVTSAVVLCLEKEHFGLKITQIKMKRIGQVFPVTTCQATKQSGLKNPTPNLSEHRGRRNSPFKIGKCLK